MRGDYKGRALCLAAVASVVTACATIMGVEEAALRDPILPDATAVPEDGAIDGGSVEHDAGCIGRDCPCGPDTPCLSDRYRTCVDGKCRECTQEPDDCPANSYCLPTNECAPGCKSDEECAQLSPDTAPRCNTQRHQCVQCLEHAHCDGELRCSPSGVCTSTCTDSCADPAKTCCGGFCLDTNADVLNCGGCDQPCSTTNGAASCATGQCAWTCNPGYSHCASGNTGCETNTATKTDQCGSCTTNCNAMVQNADGVACADSQCTYARCKASFADCDTNEANGCECPCGRENEACCAGAQCRDGLVCSSGRCVQCGDGNEPCCPGSKCSGGLTCRSGRCEPICLPNGAECSPGEAQLCCSGKCPPAPGGPKCAP